MKWNTMSSPTSSVDSLSGAPSLGSFVDQGDQGDQGDLSQYIHDVSQQVINF